MKRLQRAMYSVMLVLFVLIFAASSRQASAATFTERCTDAGIILNTAGCRGYVTNTMYWTPAEGIGGGPIIYSPSQYAIPFSVNSAASLEAFMAGLLDMANPTDYSYNYNKAGAAFIVATMLGHIGGGIGDFGNATNMIGFAKQNFYPTAGNGNYGWTTLIDGYDSGATPGFWTDWGSSGTAVTIGQGTVNTLHACPPGTPYNVCQPTNNAILSGPTDSQDFAWFALGPGETEITHPIVFNSPSGVAYILRRECGNPLGGPAFPPVPPRPPKPPYTLSPTVNDTINGAASAGNVAQVGDTIVFTYAIDNTTAGNSDPVSCNTYAQTFAGYHATVGGGEVLSGAGPGTSCPLVVTAHTNPTVATETVRATPGATTICRSFYINPFSSSAAGSKGTEDCVIVATKPYFKVFGGDTMVGAGLANAAGNCTNDTNAQLFGWNNEFTGNPATNYAGAGSEYAAFAMDAITDFASDQNGSGAGSPKSLMFANTTGSGASVFGGSFGSVPCMTDYYNTTGATALPSTNISTLTTGVYKSVAGISTPGGNVNPHVRVQIFVQGNVYISGNILYAGSWSVQAMPFFELVVKGNIYIGSGVTQLNGMYVAEKNGATGGTIYTCATGPGAPAAVTSATYFTTCGNKLTVDGSLVANEVQLLRTSGSLSSAGTGETATSNSAAESINFSPAFWINGPPSTTSGSSASNAAQYDSIASLPPIL